MCERNVIASSVFTYAITRQPLHDHGIMFHNENYMDKQLAGWLQQLHRLSFIQIARFSRATETAEFMFCVRRAQDMMYKFYDTYGAMRCRLQAHMINDHDRAIRVVYGPLLPEHRHLAHMDNIHSANCHSCCTDRRLSDAFIRRS